VSIEASIKSTLGSLVGNRVYPDVPPDNPTFPLIVYQQVGGDVLNPLEGSDPNKDNARMQVVVWSKTRLEASSIARSARIALTSTLSASMLGAPVSLHEDTLKLYGSRADYSLWFTP